jgi:5,5'-dehydrodivanillate O-demethylase oxygenase subunit
VDDTHTIQFLYRTAQRKPGAPRRPIAVKHTNVFDENGKVITTNIPAQDVLAWIAQGPISDRTREHLATSDRGVVLYHKLLNEQMERVERGLEPMALIRDPAENEPMVDINRERRTVGDAFQSRYADYFKTAAEPAEVAGK